MRSAETVLALALAAPPTLGASRLVCVDGPAGSGKTTLAGALAALAPGTRVIHMDDLYDGWAGLPHVDAQLDTLLPPLATGRPGTYRRFDWVANRFAETVTVEPAELLVLEGVGSGSLRHAALVTTLVWVSVPADLRLARGLERDGPGLEAAWRRWMIEEAEHHARQDTRARAHVLVDGTGASPPQVVGPRH